jgi:hypothetical protein
MYLKDGHLDTNKCTFPTLSIGETKGGFDYTV